MGVYDILRKYAGSNDIENHYRELYGAYEAEISQGSCLRLKDLYSNHRTNNLICVNNVEFAVINMLFNKFHGIERSIAINTNSAYQYSINAEAVRTLLSLNRYNQNKRTANTDEVERLTKKLEEEAEISKSHLERANKSTDECNMLRRQLEEAKFELEKLSKEKHKISTNIKAFIDPYERSRKRISEFESSEKERIQKEAEAQKDEIVKNQLADYIADVRQDWKNAHSEFEADRTRIANDVSQAKLQACEEASKLQRELYSEFTGLQNSLNDFVGKLGSELDTWRNSLYKIQLEEFAEWVAKFFRFVNNFDRRIANNANTPESAEFVKAGKSLTSLRNALERILPDMGLRCFYANKGDAFDSVYHFSETGEETSDKLIAECTAPGIEYVAVNGQSRVLVTATVVLEEE